MSNDNDIPCAAATPPAELERQIMSWIEPKNECEWWAKHEIDRLREVLARLTTGPTFTGYDPARGEDQSCKTTWIRRANGTLELVSIEYGI